MKGFITLVVLVVVLLAIQGLVLQFVVDLPDSYSGTEIFNTEKEYLDFKQAVLDKAVSIDEIGTLSSAPPILVKFRIEAHEFPYGVYFPGDYVIFYILSGCLAAVAVGVVLFYSLGRKDAK